MCGIAGAILARFRDPALVDAMTGCLAHRGPDGDGRWDDPDAGNGPRVVLGHRRLAIVELSPLGAQPMASVDGRWILAFNGEVYNHLAIRVELDAAGLAPAWRGHSDTETLVAAIAAWGLEATLTRCVGMFALALWDRRTRVLHLVRDRFGEKPLYYGWVGGDFLFASELKAMRAHPGFANPVDRDALAAFAARTYVPAPRSIYRDIYKLEPGCILSLSPDAAHTAPGGPPVDGLHNARNGGLTLTRYWAYRDVLAAGAADPIGSEGDAIAALDAALGEAIAGQAMADVPVGAFLSGGIDSSAVVALYQRHASTPVRTFSIGFEEAGFDEAPYARAVAAHFGTVHHERYVSVAETQAVIPLLPAMYDEPFADSSQIPTHLVSRFAREQVTVALSGDGGDELFAGYNRHVAAPRLWDRLSLLPRPVRAAAGAALGRLPPGVWNMVPGQSPHFGAKVQKAFRIAGAPRFDDIYASFLDEWNEGSPVLNAGPPPRPDLGPPDTPDALRMMYCDATTYLPDDILVKVDRAAMAVSLETRVPFLDHRVAAVAARIPLAMKIKGGRGKHVLREMLYAHAPRALFERPKAGFAIPIGQWLRGPLRGWAEELLAPARLAGEGYFDAAAVGARWRDHLSGRRDATQALWAVLMFQAWLAEQTVPGVTEWRNAS